MNEIGIYLVEEGRELGQKTVSIKHLHMRIITKYWHINGFLFNEIKGILGITNRKCEYNATMVRRNRRNYTVCVLFPLSPSSMMIIIRSFVIIFKR